MNYRELLEITKNNPGCLWTKEQKNKNSEQKFKDWLARKDEETREKSEEKIE